MHFRCRAGGVAWMQLDVMARIRGLPDFTTLWYRRTTIDTATGLIEVLSLPYLVTAKKTQHDKDWPMITRLLEADYAAYGPRADSRRTAFWLRELRTPSILIDVARSAADASTSLVPERPLLAAASAGPPPRAARWRLASFPAFGRVTSRSRKASARDMGGPMPRACDLRPSLRRTRPCGGTFRSGRRQATPPASPPVP